MYTYQRTKGKSTGQMVFGLDIILPIKNVAYWIYICQCKQEQIEKGVIREKKTRINYDYRLGYRVKIRNKPAYKYETPYKGLCEIVQTRTNGTVTLRTGAVTKRINTHHIKTYNNPDAEWRGTLQEIQTYIYTLNKKTYNPKYIHIYSHKYYN